MILLYFAVSFLLGLLLLQGLNRLLRIPFSTTKTPSPISVQQPADRATDVDNTLPALNLALFSTRQPAQHR